MGVPRAAVWIVAVVALGCGRSEAPDPRDSTEAQVPTPPSASRVEPASTSHRSRPPGQKPLPAFEGTTLDGRFIRISDLLGKRLVLFFFNPDVPDAATAARAVMQVADERGANNFDILGVGVGSSDARLRRFVAEEALDFPVIDDGSGRITRRLSLRAPVLIAGVDGEGYMVFQIQGFPEAEDDGVATTEESLREALRLPIAKKAAATSPGERPKAPLFVAHRLDGEGSFDLANAKGKPVVLIFFLHTCPHCHHALAGLRRAFDRLPEGKQPAFVPISISPRTSDVHAALKRMDLAWVVPHLDLDGSIAKSYGGVRFVPQTFLIDGDGFIAERIESWRDDRDPSLLEMRLARLVGAPVPMLLHKTGFSGNEFCVVCHETEAETWSLTRHAGAFDTLVRHGQDHDPECVSCHVVGFDSGGFDLAARSPHFEDVGCESCHGRGGPHLTRGLISDGSYESVCQTCHNPTHSLGFRYAEFLPRVSHAANAPLLALPLAEKQKILAERGKRRVDLLPSQADHVGSDACRSCHEAEYETWAASPHGHAGATLEATGQAGETACLACHTTGYGDDGGFPVGGSLAEQPDLARVGCESCHGPGGDHVQEGARRIGSIVSLGDKCDSCVILKICGSCHDDANDSGFEFEVQEKIERQRHGTIEPGTGKPIDGRTAERLPDTAALGLLERVFATAEGSG